MSEAAVVIATLFALGMAGVGLALFLKSAREKPDASKSWPDWPPTTLR